MKRKQIIALTNEDFDALHKASLIMYCIAEALGKNGKDFPFSSFDLETIAMRKDHDCQFMMTDFSSINGGLQTYASNLNEIIEKEEQK